MSGSHQIRFLSSVIVASVFLTFCSLKGRAAGVEVDLELVIAVDVSVSMDIQDQILQRQGFIDAFRDPAVVAAVKGGRRGRIAVTYVEWSGSYLQWIRVPWTVVSNTASAAAFSDAIDTAWFTRRHLTSMSGALLFASGLFSGNGFNSPRRVIDISGDGPNNDGARVDIARDIVVAKGITINGLPIHQPPGKPLGFFEIRDIDRYYKACVIGGSGAFIVPVRNRAGIAEAIRRKLVLEIAGSRPPSARVIHAAFSSEEIAPVDCGIGERLLREWWDSSEHE